MKKFKLKSRIAVICTLIIMLLTSIMPTKMAKAVTSGEGNKVFLAATNSAPAAPVDVTAVSASYNSIKISWGAVAGATGYRVYRATSSTGTYTWVKTTTLTSYTNSGLITGKTYYYKVRAYTTVGTTNIYSGLSSVVSAKPIPATPSLVKAVSVSYNSIKISWGAVAGASGYRVYRATSTTGTYTSIKETTLTSCTDSSLITGKTYYYKVRAYTTVGTTKVCSKYSKVVSCIPISYVTSVSLSKTIEYLTVGDADFLTATISPSNATNKAVKWSSSNTSVVKVDSIGRLIAVGAGTATIKVTTVDGSKTASCNVTVNNKKGYVQNPELQYDLKVRSAPNSSGTVLGYMYNYEKIEILDTVLDDKNNKWDKITYNGSFAYVSDAYIQRYTSPPDDVATTASNITRQFEVGSLPQIQGNFDGQGLSLGYLQWCIGQGTLQKLLHRMDRQYNSEMKSIFGTNYNSIHSMLLDTLTNQLTWAKNINDSANNIKSPWNTQLENLTKNQHFISIEKDAEVYFTKQAMLICDKYKLRTVRGYALAFDIVVQNGSISQEARNIIDSTLLRNSGMTEKELLAVIAKAVSLNSPDTLSRKMTIVNGQGTVHGIPINLDSTLDKCWR